MNRIEQTFSRLKAAQRTALIPYVTAGDPSPQLTVPILHGLVAAGADLLELGMPFSDPMADGPAIQRAAERALAQGMNLRRTLDLVAQFRQGDSTTPLVLMGYANPVERMGYGEFARAAAAAGVDGVLLVDVPPEESVRAELAQHGLDNIFLIAPTTSGERMGRVAAQASGFVYYVSLKGVTGSRALDLAEVAQRVPLVRQQCALPVGVGFGIRDAQTAAEIGRFADAVVIGSRIVEEIERAPVDQLVASLADWLSGVRTALDAAGEAERKAT